MNMNNIHEYDDKNMDMNMNMNVNNIHENEYMNT
jgi:hypothetical protein